MIAVGSDVQDAVNAALQGLYDKGVEQLIPIVLLVGTSRPHECITITGLPQVETAELMRLMADQTERNSASDWVERPTRGRLS
jgi:hypothetical protein